MSRFEIAELAAGGGMLGISPLPGRFTPYPQDLDAVLDWSPGLVMSLTRQEEMHRHGTERLGADMRAAGVAWRHLPVADFGVPCPEVSALWPEASRAARGCLADGGRVLAHCYGGCGRSGMALLRLMVELGEDGPGALARLREVRPCAVETVMQMSWAMGEGAPARDAPSG